MPRAPSNTPYKPPLVTNLPPDIVTCIFSYLPIPELGKLGCVSRRFKVFSYSDELFEPKLRALGLEPEQAGSLTEAEGELKDRLAARLRQLPGGQFLSTNTAKYVIQPESEIGIESVSLNDEKPKQLITSALPNTKIASMIIGAGGIKAALLAEKQRVSGKPVVKKALVLSSSRPVGSRPFRDVFRQVYTELIPYYLDFRKKQKDSKVFKDYKDSAEIGAILKRLKLFDLARFLEDTEHISFALESTIEWFESTILGQFEKAYDRKDLDEMKQTANADYQLNGGIACVNVFISKNPVFFDHTFNPSLVASKLPTAKGPSVGFALADEFAKFMDYMLGNCMDQSHLISHVFVPDVNAMTLFVNKVFEDSISEYLTAILMAAKAREGQLVYLHTLATTVFCCTQFIELIVNNPQKVPVEFGVIKKSLQEIFRPYSDKYIDLELDNLGKKYKVELDGWDKKRAKVLQLNRVEGNSGYIKDAQKTKEHHKFVLNTMKAVLYAPVQLTKTTIGLIGQGVGLIRQNSEALLEDAEPIEYKDEKVEEVTYKLDNDSLNSLVSLELCLHLMHSNKECLGRALIIAANTDVTKLYDGIMVGDPIAIDRLGKSKPVDTDNEDLIVNMDSLQFFELIHVADVIQQMVDVYYSEDVKLWIDEQDFLSDIVIEKKAFERLIDDLVAGGMDKVIQVLVNQTEYVLVTEHKLTDYNPPETGIFDWKPTKACRKVIKCLNAYAKVISGVAEKNTIEVFFGEVGDSVIIKNIRKLPVSQTGAMQLICDMNTYYEWSVAMRYSSVTKLFQVLKELGNIFLADGSEELRKLVHDTQRFQGALRVEEIYEILQSRTDYKKIQKQVEAKECLIQ